MSVRRDSDDSCTEAIAEAVRSGDMNPHRPLTVRVLDPATDAFCRPSPDDDDEGSRLRGPSAVRTYSHEEADSVSADDEEQLTELEDQGPLSTMAILLLNVSFFGLNLMFLILSVEIVPAQVEAMVGPQNKGSVLGGMVAGGAILTFLSGPLIGMKSDRLSTRYGRRRPIMVIAVVCLCLGLLGMAFSAPEVNLEGPNITANSSTNGICNIDLEFKRCRPYYSNKTNLEQFVSQYNKKRLSLQTLEADTPEVKLRGTLGLFIPFYLVVTVSYVCVMTPYNALIADKSHHQQRGLNSGVMGGMILMGNIGGAALGLAIVRVGVLCIYGIVMAILLLCIFITVIFTGERPSKQVHRPFECRDAVYGFWSPLKEPDFRWLFITRFLMQQGVTTVVGFLEYWLGDMIPLPYCWNPAKGVSLMLLPMLVFAAASSVVCGFVSDRLGRRKPLIIIASIMMAIVAGFLAGMRGKYSFYISCALAVVFGLAFGGYQAVDFALLMDILPAEKDKSRDIAVWQQAMVLPQATAVPVGGIILDLFERVNCRIGLGYIIIFIVTSVYFLLSGVFVVKITRAR